MPNPYNHFLKLELNDADIKQLKDAFYGKKPQEMDNHLLELELNNEDLSELEQAFYSKKSQDAVPAEPLNKNKSLQIPEDGSKPSLKKRKNFFGSEQNKQMKKYMFKIDLDIKTNQDDIEEKNKEDNTVSTDQNMFRLDVKTGNVTQYHQRTKSRGPQHRYIFKFNSNTGKLTNPQEEQEDSSFSVSKPSK
ncbi:hypothetical protein DGG96_01245 [Legionella qingyii]|uniref:Uncharacterized protein n=1 Tax=Legionella qingyii TaxID=2184757 RepID=A0A317UAB1_9GAMM|nr:hypothetical protein [Legionella qingyii]PWY57008.1 hypothetical protein DGG96_03180 [Legionella qingyii]PWY57370.1 hypothetical protein DGG96_01245 [Legionella qingyii]RUR26459.1 hypothetical protein ELY20_00650 [Legionella qingyii]